MDTRKGGASCFVCVLDIRQAQLWCCARLVFLSQQFQLLLPPQGGLQADPCFRSCSVSQSPPVSLFLSISPSHFSSDSMYVAKCVPRTIVLYRMHWVSYRCCCIINACPHLLFIVAPNAETVSREGVQGVSASSGCTAPHCSVSYLVCVCAQTASGFP